MRRRLWSDVKWEYREVKRRRRGDCWSRNEQHLFYKVLSCAKQYITVMHCAVLYCAVMYPAVLTALCYSALYCTRGAVQ